MVIFESGPLKGRGCYVIQTGAPQLSNDGFSLTAGGGQSALDVLANDSLLEYEAGDLTIEIDENGAPGTFGGVDGSNRILYTPPATPGDVTFFYRAYPTAQPTLISNTASVSVSVQAAADTYAAVVQGLSGLVAYWDMDGLSAIEDQGPNSIDGTWDGPVAAATGLPADSGAATLLDGTLGGQIPHAAALALPAFTLSLWVTIHSAPTEFTAIIAKDASGLFNGNFALVLIEEGGEAIVYPQFQSGSATFAGPSVELNFGQAYHLVVTAGPSGFEFTVDGRLRTSVGTFTDGWTNNTEAITVGKVPWSAVPGVNITIDEVAIYSRVLTAAEICSLAQQEGDPVAVDHSFSMQEGLTQDFDVVTASAWRGRLNDLVVQLWDGDSWGSTITTANGSVTVNADKTLEFTADEVGADVTDDFDYRLTDLNGSSAAGTVEVTIQNVVASGEDDGFGGTLVYSWEPKQAWITGQSLAQRGPSSVHDINKWNANANSGATVGGSMVKSVILAGPQKNYYWNNAPTGDPALEIWTPPPGHADAAGPGSSIINIGFQLWNLMNSGGGPYPRRVRVVMEIKGCRAADPTTFKGAGKGTTSGAYPDFKLTYLNTSNAAVKYFIGAWAGDGIGGGGTINWWNDHTLSPRRTTCRAQPSAGNPTLKPYCYNFDRPGKHGTAAPGTIRIDESGINGVWHRLELDWKLTTPALAVSANARRRNPPLEPSHIGDGAAHIFVTKDIDNLLGGGAGTRQRSSTGFGVAASTGAIWSPAFDDVGSDDDMHLVANVGGFWISLIYGGSTAAQAEGWSWIRKIQVYHYEDEDL
jgi:hypothetical protein